MPLSEEQKKAQSERMKAYNAAKKEEILKNGGIPEEKPSNLNPFKGEPPVEMPMPNETEDLRNQINELKATMFDLLSKQNQTSSVNTRTGMLVGTTEKYLVDPANYPDPCERLSNEPRLERFAFKINYELKFEVGVTSYETIDHIRMREPKFMLELHRVVMDEETGQPTKGRYVVCRSIFHEDPEAAILIARENGLTVDEINQKVFLDEMRYLRMRDWLLQAFYPAKLTSQPRKKEVVIGNKLVEFFETSGENPQSIPFDKINKKG